MSAEIIISPILSPILLESRIKYLESLKTLPDNWISGESVKPSVQVISNGINFLEKLIEEKNIFQKKSELLISPIPSGGIGFEFRFNENNAIFTSIFNNKKLKYILLKDTNYIEKQITYNKLIDTFLKDYQLFQNKK